MKREHIYIPRVFTGSMSASRSSHAVYARWRVLLDDGTTVVRKFCGTRAEVIDAIWGAVDAKPIGSEIHDY